MPPDVTNRPTVTWQGARRVLDAAARAAGRMGVACCLAAADSAGNLPAFDRMDGAPLLSVRIAQDKAYTVAAFNGVPTHEWYGMIAGEPALLHGIVHTERLVEEALARILGRTTGIVVAHRASTVLLADRVALLQDGTITHVGRHRDLLAQVPAYRELLAAEPAEMTAS